MGLKVINSQGTVVTVIKAGTNMDDCTAVATAFAGGDVVGCPQSLGELSETRTSTEIKCLSSNETAKIMGSVSRGTLEMGLLLDPSDTAGQMKLKEAFANNEPVIIGIELPNIPAGTGTGGNGTRYYFDAGVGGVSTGIAMDTAISYNVTLEVASVIGECPAVAPTP